MKNVAKVIVMLLACWWLTNCSTVEMKEVMTFEMFGDCSVYGPWEEPLSSKGAPVIKVLRPNLKAPKGYLQLYDFQWDTDFTYKEDSILFSAPFQTKNDKYQKKSLRAKGWIYGEDMYIQYDSQAEGYEGSINCEVFGKQINKESLVESEARGY